MAPSFVTGVGARRTPNESRSIDGPIILRMFYAINNRSNQQAISYFNFGRGGNNPLTSADVGEGFLVRLGYTIVDAGWEGATLARVE
jgi:hypothetical protein